MNGKNPELEQLADLREEIDRIDDQIHDLLMRRVDVVQGIAKIKNTGQDEQEIVPSLAWRPAREALIMRRLASRHRGDLPFSLVVRLWRELVATTTRLQGPFSLVLPVSAAGAEARHALHLARFYYGSETPVRLVPSPASVFEAVLGEPGAIGLLPMTLPADPLPDLPFSDMPETESLDLNDEPWWVTLYKLRETRAPGLGPARIIAALPLSVATAVAEKGAPFPLDAVEAMTIGCLEPQASGEDTTLLAVELQSGVDPVAGEAAVAEGLAEALRQVGIGAQTDAVLAWDAWERYLLFAVAGHTDGQGPLFDRVLADRHVHRLASLGGFAHPVVEPRRGPSD